MPPTLHAAVPILRMFSPAKAKKFDVECLGFRVDWEHRCRPDFPLDMQMSRGGLVLHLSEHHGDACLGSSLRARVEGLDAYHGELSAKGDGFMNPGIENTEWGTREVSVIDPFGNRIHFHENHPKDEGR
jgi:uncharacterized glyoxalase superfamily protein PhnB